MRRSHTLFGIPGSLGLCLVASALLMSLGCATQRASTAAGEETMMKEERVTDPLANLPVSPAPRPSPDMGATPPSSSTPGQPSSPVSTPSMALVPGTMGDPAMASPGKQATAPLMSAATDGEVFLLDIPFDFDRHQFRFDAKNMLEVNAGRLRDQQGWNLLLEGRCDEVGTTDYNLVLGQRRADAVKDYLIRLDLPGTAIETVSYGKERPLCADHSTICWEKNRTVRFVLR